MKILLLLCTFFVFTFANAQNKTEAKMAYQMAEENFEAKQYVEALDNLKNAEKALGSINPPMAYLKVMIVDQIATTYKETLSFLYHLETAIEDFDKTKGKEALGEDKLMNVYRIKMNLEKRKKPLEKIASIRKQYDEMITRLSTEFPKTDLTVNELIESIPESWIKLNYDKSTEKRMKKKQLNDHYFFEDSGIQLKKLSIVGVKTLKAGEDQVKSYYVNKLLNTNKDVKSQVLRELMVQEICELLKISEENWADFTTGDRPLILKVDHRGWNSYLIIKYDEDGKRKFYMSFDNRAYPRPKGEILSVTIEENKL